LRELEAKAGTPDLEKDWPADKYGKAKGMSPAARSIRERCLWAVFKGILRFTRASKPVDYFLS
jgi:hypothetical protein